MPRFLLESLQLLQKPRLKCLSAIRRLTDPPNIIELPIGAGAGAPSDSQPSRCSNAYDVAWTRAIPASADLQMNT